MPLCPVAPPAEIISAREACRDAGECYLSALQSLQAGDWDLAHRNLTGAGGELAIYLRGAAAWCDGDLGLAGIEWERNAQSISERWQRLGQYRLDHGDPSAAIEWLSLATRLAPTGDRLRALGRAHEVSAAPQRALELYREALQFEPTRAEHFYQVAGLESELREYEPARRHMEIAVERAPQEWSYWHRYGNVLYNLQAWPAAETAFRRAVALDPKNGNSNGGAGLALIHQGRWQEARSFILDAGRYAAPATHQAGFLAAFARAAAQHGDHAAAAEFYDMAFERDSSNASVGAALLHEYVQLGDCLSAAQIHARLVALEQAHNRAASLMPECPPTP
jgi:tetratricopeptide (TPR) repeat protein